EGAKSDRPLTQIVGRGFEIVFDSRGFGDYLAFKGDVNCGEDGDEDTANFLYCMCRSTAARACGRSRWRLGEQGLRRLGRQRPKQGWAGKRRVWPGEGERRPAAPSCRRHPDARGPRRANGRRGGATWIPRDGVVRALSTGDARASRSGAVLPAETSHPAAR